MIVTKQELRDNPVFTRSYNGFSGVNIQGVYKEERFAFIQALSLTVSREMAPTGGRGRRGIAGSLIFAQVGTEPFVKRKEEYRSNNWYPDQIPPFDVIMTAANEDGGLAEMKVIGVKLLYNGYGLSFDDIRNECPYNFIASNYISWKRIEKEPELFIHSIDQDIEDGMIVNPITGRKSWL